VVEGFKQVKEKILITGANGQLGLDIVEYCSINGIEHYPATRNSFDITNTNDVVKFIRKYKPTKIIHCAAFTAVDDCEIDIDKALFTNQMGTTNIVKAADLVKAHITYISSDYVFDGEKGEPYTENDTPAPVSVYGISKFLGEQELRPTDAVVRTSWVNGRHGKNIVKTILRIAQDSTELSFVNDQKGSPSFTEDIAPVIVNISRNSAHGPWHVTNQGEATWYEFAKNVLSIAGIHTEVMPISTEEMSPPRPARRPRNSVLDNMRLRDAGFQPTDHYIVPLTRLVGELVSS